VHEALARELLSACDVGGRRKMSGRDGRRWRGISQKAQIRIGAAIERENGSLPEVPGPTRNML
jgi:hypothetical protein